MVRPGRKKDPKIPKVEDVRSYLRNFVDRGMRIHENIQFLTESSASAQMQLYSAANPALSQDGSSILPDFPSTPVLSLERMNSVQISSGSSEEINSCDGSSSTLTLFPLAPDLYLQRKIDQQMNSPRNTLNTSSSMSIHSSHDGSSFQLMDYPLPSDLSPERMNIDQGISDGSSTESCISHHEDLTDAVSSSHGGSSLTPTLFPLFPLAPDLYLQRMDDQQRIGGGSSSNLDHIDETEDYNLSLF